MVGRSKKPIHDAAIVDFDDQLWPIDCAIIVLTGVVAGVIVGLGGFDDTRWLFNAWFRLATLTVLTVAAFWAVRNLQGRILRRVQLCLLLSLILHLWTAVVLHKQYLVVVAQREAEIQQAIEQPEKITVPDYHWEYIEKRDSRHSFEEPVETESPTQTEPDAVRRQEIKHDVPIEKKTVVEPESPRPERPNPADIQRAEFTAPRRAQDAAGMQVSRQEWKNRPVPNQPVPEPRVKPEGKRVQTLSPTELADVKHKQTKAPKRQRQVFQTDPSTIVRRDLMKLARRSSNSQPTVKPPSTPTPSRQMVRPADVARTDAAAPKPVETARQLETIEPKSNIVMSRQRTDLPTSARSTPEPGRVGQGSTIRLKRAGNAIVRPVDIGQVGAGSVRKANRMTKGRLVEETDRLAVVGQPSSGGKSIGAKDVPLQTTVKGHQRQAAGLVGTLTKYAPVDAATVAGGSTATPSTMVGPRRLLSEGKRQPSLVAEIGGASVRKKSTVGLPSGLAETTRQWPVVAEGKDGEPRLLDVVAVIGARESGRREGGLPVRIAAQIGQGGLSHKPLAEVGIPNRRARSESEVVHTIASRFIIERSGGRLAIDGRVREMPTEAFRQRDPGRRVEVAKTFGGTDGTEAAVENGLDYFVRQQFKDGHWSLNEFPNTDDDESEDVAGGQMQSDSGATGLALLSFLGAGYTHLGDKHKMVVQRGLDWLVRNQKPNGELFVDGTSYARLYSHGIAAIALCEAYGMTRDPGLRRPAEKAIQFIIDSQHPTRGGWRYEPGKESDTSVSGWQLMALKSAQMAGLDVPEGVLKKVGIWLDAAQTKDGTQFAYNPFANDSPEQIVGRRPNNAMTAEGLLMRMYLGASRNDDYMIEGAKYLRANLPDFGSQSRPLRDSYYWYYATQVMFQMQGPYWADWNDRLQPLLEGSQEQEGPMAGSWHPNRPLRDRWAHAGGRNYVTAMNLLMLEVYYRHLPLFRLE